MPTIEIVPYEIKYRDAVRECVYETGYGGESVAPFFESKELFADYLTLYYTDYEPESAMVPLVDGVPAGYLLGCINTESCNKISDWVIRPRIIRDVVLGRYGLGPNAKRYIYRTLLQIVRGEYIHTPNEEYPAHLHIDLMKPFRRYGIGTKLITKFLEYAREHGAKGVHLGTSSFHTQALPFYDKLGFQRYAVRRVTDSYFKDVTDKNYYEICYVKSLA